MAERLLQARDLSPDVKQLFWKWRDPAHVPGLLKHLKRNSDFEELSAFAEARPALRHQVTEWMSRSKPVMEAWTGDQLSVLYSALASGNTEALEVLLHLARCMNSSERIQASRSISVWIAPLFGWPKDKSGAEAGKFLDSLLQTKAGDFSFDPERQRWERVK